MTKKKNNTAWYIYHGQIYHSKIVRSVKYGNRSPIYILEDGAEICDYERHFSYRSALQKQKDLVSHVIEDIGIKISSLERELKLARLDLDRLNKKIRKDDAGIAQMDNSDIPELQSI